MNSYCPKPPRLLSAAAAAVALSWSLLTAAQGTPPPERSQAWGTVSTVSVLVGAGTQLIMPRVYWADAESTIGWKSRWHVSVLAPVMTLTAVTLANEYALKPAVESYRPGCDATNQGGPGCGTYGSPSSHSLAAFSAFGHGTGVFLVDTLKWNDGRFNAGAFVGDVVVPLISAVFGTVGRVAGDPGYERGSPVLLGAGVGLGLGLLTGLAYSLLQRPECGYGSGIVCW
jgi:hypothetical protein